MHLAIPCILHLAFYLDFASHICLNEGFEDNVVITMEDEAGRRKRKLKRE